MLLAAACALAVSLAAAGQGKDTFTPMALDAGFGRIDLTEPSVPPEIIIKQFAAKESEFEKALDHYTFRRVVRVQTIGDDNKVTGEYYQVDDVIFDPSGKRTEKVVYAPENTLREISMSPSDFQDIQHGLFFVLTAENIDQYNIKYVGRQKVDEVDCYVFDVSPKMILKGKRYLDGRIWIDQTDLQIVVTNGRMVPDDTRKGSEDLHPPFMTWRQQVDGHYWFPVYTKGEGFLHFAGGHGAMAQDVHIRETMKYTDYKQFGATNKLIFEGKEATQPETQPASPPKK
jgi:hypothetical protein